MQVENANNVFDRMGYSQGQTTRELGQNLLR